MEPSPPRRGASEGAFTFMTLLPAVPDFTKALKAGSDAAALDGCDARSAEEHASAASTPWTLATTSRLGSETPGAEGDSLNTSAAASPERRAAPPPRLPPLEGLHLAAGSGGLAEAGASPRSTPVAVQAQALPRVPFAAALEAVAGSLRDAPPLSSSCGSAFSVRGPASASSAPASARSGEASDSRVSPSSSGATSGGNTTPQRGTGEEPATPSCMLPTAPAQPSSSSSSSSVTLGAASPKATPAVAAPTALPAAAALTPPRLTSAGPTMLPALALPAPLAPAHAPPPALGLPCPFLRLDALPPAFAGLSLQIPLPAPGWGNGGGGVSPASPAAAAPPSAALGAADCPPTPSNRRGSGSSAAPGRSKASSVATPGGKTPRKVSSGSQGGAEAFPLGDAASAEAAAPVAPPLAPPSPGGSRKAPATTTAVQPAPSVASGTRDWPAHAAGSLRATVAQLEAAPLASPSRAEVWAPYDDFGGGASPSVALPAAPRSTPVAAGGAGSASRGTAPPPPPPAVDVSSCLNCGREFRVQQPRIGVRDGWLGRGAAMGYNPQHTQARAPATPASGLPPARGGASTAASGDRDFCSSDCRSTCLLRVCGGSHDLLAMVSGQAAIPPHFPFS